MCTVVVYCLKLHTCVRDEPFDIQRHIHMVDMLLLHSPIVGIDPILARSRCVCNGRSFGEDRNAQIVCDIASRGNPLPQGCNEFGIKIDVKRFGRRSKACFERLRSGERGCSCRRCEEKCEKRMVHFGTDFGTGFWRNVEGITFEAWDQCSLFISLDQQGRHRLHL